MRRNGYLWTSGINLDTAVPFADPDFLVECKISAIWRRFPLIIAFYILNVRHISTSNPHVDNSHQVWSWYDYISTAELQRFCHVTWWPWPFDLEQLSYMAGHVHNPATEFEDPKTIRSWVTSYNGSHWLALKMRTRPLRMRRTNHVTRE